ncbi:unnamed protein product, partial [Ranitomeya imitator]
MTNESSTPKYPVRTAISRYTWPGLQLRDNCITTYNHWREPKSRIHNNQEIEDRSRGKRKKGDAGKGGNDLGSSLGKGLSANIRKDVRQLELAYPSMRLVWSDMVPRRKRQGARSVERINKAQFSMCGKHDLATLYFSIQTISIRTISIRTISIYKDTSIRTISTRAISIQTISIRTISIRTISIRTISIRTISIQAISIRTISIRTISIQTISIRTTSIRTTSIRTTSIQTISIRIISIQTINMRTIIYTGYQYTDGHQYTGHQYTGHQYMDHQYTDHKYMDHQYTDHQYTGHQYTDHQYTDHQYTDHQYTDHQYTDHQYMDHQYTDHQYTDHQYTDHQYTGPSAISIPAISIRAISKRAISTRTISIRTTSIQTTSIQTISIRTISIQAINIRTISIRTISIWTTIYGPSVYTGYQYTDGHQYTGHQYTGHQYMDHQYTDHKYMDHQYTDHQYTGHQYTDHQYTDHQYTDHQYTDHQYTDHQYMDHQYTDHQYTDHQYTDHQYTDHQCMDHQYIWAISKRAISTRTISIRTTIWYILRKKESSGELINAKRPGCPQKTTVVDDRRIISMVKRNPFTTANQVNNTLQEVGISISKSTIREDRMKMDNDPKHKAKATQEFIKAKKWNILEWPSQSPDLNPIEHAFHLLKTKLQTERPTNKQQLKTTTVKAWQSFKKNETQHLVMSMSSTLQAVIANKGFSTQESRHVHDSVANTGCLGPLFKRSTASVELGEVISSYLFSYTRLYTSSYQSSNPVCLSASRACLSACISVKPVCPSGPLPYPSVSQCHSRACLPVSRPQWDQHPQSDSSLEWHLVASYCTSDLTIRGSSEHVGSYLVTPLPGKFGLWSSGATPDARANRSRCERYNRDPQCAIMLNPKRRVTGSNQGAAMKKISQKKRNSIIQLIDWGLSAKRIAKLHHVSAMTNSKLSLSNHSKAKRWTS